MPPILRVFMLQFFYLLKYKQNTAFVDFLKPEEAYAGCPLYRNA